MSIEPLPPLNEPDEQHGPVYESVVVRYGYLRHIAELPCPDFSLPPCGTPLVIRSPRGIELARLLSPTCAGGHCGLSITRKQMLSYIEQSGGRQYPFTTEGKVLRIASPEDLREQQHLDAGKPRYVRTCKQFITELDLPMKLVDVELLLGGDRIVFYFMAESRVDFRELVRKLAGEFHTRIEMRQVGARDEARLVADYEKCGRHCCCRQFLKVLRPVSMKSAKVQKATLDPSKISGRCGRLMCCLRYEEKTYDQLRRNLPERNTRVLTADGLGSVLSTQILTQLVLVRLDENPLPQAYPVEGIETLSVEREEQIKAELQAHRQAQLEKQEKSRRQSRPTPSTDSRQAVQANAQNPAPSPDPSGQDQSARKRKRRRRRKKRKKPGRNST